MSHSRICDRVVTLPRQSCGRYLCSSPSCNGHFQEMRFQLFRFVALFSPACAPTQLPRSTEPVDLVVATTTDVHGRLREWDYYTNQAQAVLGLLLATTMLDRDRFANPGR